jgi:hypothetical protein
MDPMDPERIRGRREEEVVVLSVLGSVSLLDSVDIISSAFILH